MIEKFSHGWLTCSVLKSFVKDVKIVSFKAKWQKFTWNTFLSLQINMKNSLFSILKFPNREICQFNML